VGAPAGQVTVPRSTALLAAEGHLYGGGPGKVYALALPLEGSEAHPVSEATISGTPLHLATGGSRLFVSTREGRVYAFGAEGVKARRHKRESTPLPSADKTSADLAEEVLKASKARSGYALLYGAGTGGLLSAVFELTEPALVVIEPDADRAAALRKRLIAADVDFKRCCVVPKPPDEAELPPYLCELATAEDLSGFTVDEDFFDLLYRSLRPY